MAVKENQHLADGSAVLLMSLLLFHVKQLSSNQKKRKENEETKRKKIYILSLSKELE